ncbi:MAG TPA: hypothetical protein VN977_06730 [Candidatus Binatia bacterium]|nr:hypothetical protein [Candidatus Binatia bacterium]
MPKDILVVEDEPDIRRLVVLHLEREGFRCRTASNGADARATSRVLGASKEGGDPSAYERSSDPALSRRL